MSLICTIVMSDNGPSVCRFPIVGQQRANISTKRLYSNPSIRASHVPVRISIRYGCTSPYAHCTFQWSSLLTEGNKRYAVCVVGNLKTLSFASFKSNNGNGMLFFRFAQLRALCRPFLHIARMKFMNRKFLRCTFFSSLCLLLPPLLVFNNNKDEPWNGNHHHQQWESCNRRARISDALFFRSFSLPSPSSQQRSQLNHIIHLCSVLAREMKKKSIIRRENKLDWKFHNVIHFSLCSCWLFSWAATMLHRWFKICIVDIFIRPLWELMLYASVADTLSSSFVWELMPENGRNHRKNMTTKSRSLFINSAPAVELNRSSLCHRPC